MKLSPFALVTFLKNLANSKIMMTFMGKMGLDKPKTYET
jgi:hypothetical protein